MRFSARTKRTNRLRRSEIRFAIGESPVPGLTGKMWLGESKLRMLPAPSTSNVPPPPVRAQSELLSEQQKADSDCAGKQCERINERRRATLCSAHIPRINKLLKQRQRACLRDYITPSRKEVMQLPTWNVPAEWHFAQNSDAKQSRSPFPFSSPPTPDSSLSDCLLNI